MLPCLTSGKYNLLETVKRDDQSYLDFRCFLHKKLSIKDGDDFVPGTHLYL